MADWRQKMSDISKTKGDSAPESAKRAGMGCLIGVIVIVSILTLVMAVGLTTSGHWLIGGFTLLFFAACAVTFLALIWPHKPKPL
ncbi:hypothetical protein [Planococcus sp. ISL-109]|uniref:hypothetical protein n=1 Tax=Planococcus sp. ISL-109 TaxID=2819166 RepID=UPI001BE65D01|nr:hypothetical protein [Planococcus sp. ISL-109]MBT2583047.1 hypothetical protein [Planococcus sp. ISL-109]